MFNSACKSTNRVEMCSKMCPHREKGFDIVLYEGDNVLPVQYVSQPARLSLHVMLLSALPSTKRHVLHRRKEKSTVKPRATDNASDLIRCDTEIFLCYLDEP